MGACVTGGNQQSPHPLNRLNSIRVECADRKYGHSSYKVALVLKVDHVHHSAEETTNKVRIYKKSG